MLVKPAGSVMAFNEEQSSKARTPMLSKSVGSWMDSNKEQPANACPPLSPHHPCKPSSTPGATSNCPCTGPGADPSQRVSAATVGLARAVTIAATLTMDVLANSAAS